MRGTKTNSTILGFACLSMLKCIKGNGNGFPNLFSQQERNMETSHLAPHGVCLCILCLHIILQCLNVLFLFSV